MHGIVHRSLKEYVVENVDGSAWDAVLEESGIEPKLYLPVSHYPDEEVDAVIATIASLTDNDEGAVQRDVGRFLAPELVNTFEAHVRRGWSTLEVLDALPGVLEAIAAQNADTDPPGIESDRIAEDVVMLTYRSERNLCLLGEGLIEGLASHYGEDVDVTQEKCVHEGDASCQFAIERVA